MIVHPDVSTRARHANENQTGVDPLPSVPKRMRSHLVIVNTSLVNERWRGSDNDAGTVRGNSQQSR